MTIADAVVPKTHQAIAYMYVIVSAWLAMQKRTLLHCTVEEETYWNNVLCPRVRTETYDELCHLPDARL